MLVLVSETLLTQFYCMMKVRILFTTPTSQADGDPAQVRRLHSLNNFSKYKIIIGSHSLAHLKR